MTRDEHLRYCRGQIKIAGAFTILAILLSGRWAVLSALFAFGVLWWDAADVVDDAMWDGVHPPEGSS